MLSISPKSASSKGASEQVSDYLAGENSREIDDYYAAGSGGDGHWHGDANLLQALGIDPASPSSSDDRVALMEGRDPRSGEYLLHSRSSSRRMGWDATFSAPKSVSILWGTASDEIRAAIESAHKMAVQKAMQEAASMVYTRTGHGGTGRAPAGVVWTSHLHGTSRALDPQLHSHNFVYNITRNEKGEYRTIAAEEIYRNKLYLGALYRAELAANLKKLGFTIEEDGKSFRIAGVEKEIEREFSKRRVAILEEAERRGVHDAKGMEIVAKAGRAKKIEGVNSRDLMPRWRAIAKELGMPEISMIMGAQNKSKVYDRKELFDRLTQGQSTFSDGDLKKELAIYAQHCGLGIDFVKAEYQEILKDKELVCLDEKKGIYSTKSMIEIERDMINFARQMKRNMAHKAIDPTRAVEDYERRAGYQISDEQRAAVEEMLGGQLAIVRGVAGAGKTTAAAIAREALNHNGYHVIGTAISAKAARGLSEASDEQMTIARLAIDLVEGRRKLSNRDVIMVDEAGMLGSRATRYLLSEASKAGARVVLVGDERQIQSIEAGGAFAALRRYAAQGVEITAIRRQRHGDHVAAVRMAERGDIVGSLGIHARLGNLHIDTDRASAIDRVAAAYVDLRLGGAATREIIITAANRADVSAINERIRDALGIAGTGVEIAGHEGQRIEIAENDRIIFRKNDKKIGVANGDLGTVEKIEQQQGGQIILHVRRDRDGELIKIDTSEYGSIQHGYAMTVHAAQGVTVDHSIAYLDSSSSLASRELAYVQLSRHRETLQIIGHAADAQTEAEARAKIEQAYGRISAKGTTLDYTQDMQQQAQQQAAQQAA